MRQLAVILSLVVSGCSSETVRGSGDCTSTDDCAPGEVCVGSQCERVCRSDGDCANGEICTDDVCRTGTRDSGPVITSIDADGTADDASGHAAHHIDTRLYILGESLEGSAVYLDDGSVQHTLEVCSSTDTRLEVALPADLQPGDHTLSVVTQGGQCDAVLPTLQGEAGSPDTGNDIVTKINNDATTLIDASQITAVDAATLTGMSAADFALSSHSHVGQYLAVADGSVGTANPWFLDGMNGWNVSSRSGTVVDTASSPSGKAFANVDDELAWIHSEPIQVDPNRTYVVRGRFENTTTTATAGNIYLAVVLYDAAGSLISGDGSWWYYAVRNYDASAAGWYNYTMRFGWYTNRPFPAEAATMAVGAILNYDNNNPGNRIFHVTGLGVELEDGAEWQTRQHIERYSSICAAMGYASGWANVAAVTPGDASVTLNGNEVCANYVGNNNRTGWTCISVPYVYTDMINRDPTGRYFGTDIRPTWRGCAVDSGPGNYPWLDPWSREGVMMACCGRAP